MLITMHMYDFTRWNFNILAFFIYISNGPSALQGCSCHDKHWTRILIKNNSKFKTLDVLRLGPFRIQGYRVSQPCSDALGYMYSWLCKQKIMLDFSRLRYEKPETENNGRKASSKGECVRLQEQGHLICFLHYFAETEFFVFSLFL